MARQYQSGTGLALNVTATRQYQSGSGPVVNANNGAAAPDTLGPVLSSPTGAATGPTTASATVVTDEGNGTLWCLISTNAIESAATTKASGTSQAVSSAGTKTFNLSSLLASTLYYSHFYQEDAAAANPSNVVHSTSFTTPAAGDTDPPTLTSPTGTKTGSTTATGTVSTNEATGVLRCLTSTNATETQASVLASGSSQAVTATGVQNVSKGSLTPGATMRHHFIHTDGSGNSSAVASSAAFTLDAAATGTITIPPLVNNTGTPWASNTNVSVHIATIAYPPAALLTLSARSTDAGGNLAAISNAALTTGSTVRAYWKVDSGDEGMMQLTVT